jgi:hypothetical protein
MAAISGLFTRLFPVVRPPPAALGSCNSLPENAGEGARATLQLLIRNHALHFAQIPVAHQRR